MSIKGKPEEVDDINEYRPTPIHKRIEANQIHWKRRTDIIKKHPEVKQLYGKDPMSAAFSVVVVSTVYALAYGVYDFSKSDHAQNNPKLFLFEIFLLAYCIGAVLDHSLWVLIHDFGHDLGFESDFLNSTFMIISNLPHLLPSASSFKFYHKLHHISLNETYSDPDVASPWESKFFGNTPIGKALWLFLFSIMQLTRGARGPMMPISIELIFNYITSFGLNIYFMTTFGFHASIFLAISSFFAIGLHPLGARWIAEHYAVHPDQETYSYYGVLNKVMFNIGYHNEHHDFPQTIPWTRLPEVREVAKDFYSNLHIHKSYLMVLWNFIFDKNFNILSRVVRDDRKTSEADGDVLISSKSD